MKLLVLATMIGVCACLSQPRTSPAREPRRSPPVSGGPDGSAIIEAFRNVIAVEGQYDYGYKTSNGIQFDESGSVRNPGAPPDDRIMEVKGSYSFVTPEGVNVVVTYEADDRGFVPNVQIN